MLTVSANMSGVVIDIEEVYIGETKLTETSDYTISENKITVKKEAMSSLPEEDYVITIELDGLADLTVDLKVVDSSE